MQDQLASFKDFNIAANWERPYSTLEPSYQATVIRSFYELYARVSLPLLRDSNA